MRQKAFLFFFSFSLFFFLPPLLSFLNTSFIFLLPLLLLFSVQATETIAKSPTKTEIDRIRPRTLSLPSYPPEIEHFRASVVCDAPLALGLWVRIGWFDWFVMRMRLLLGVGGLMLVVFGLGGGAEWLVTKFREGD